MYFVICSIFAVEPLIDVATNLSTRREKLAAMHAASGRVVESVSRVAISTKMTEEQIKEWQEELSAAILLFKAEQETKQKKAQDLTLKKTQYKLEVEKLQIKQEQYRKWIDELICFATKTSQKSATFFFSARGKKPFEIDFQKKKEVFFVNILDTLHQDSMSERDSDLEDDFSRSVLDVDREEQQDSMCEVLLENPFSILLERLSKIYFSDNAETDMAKIKKDFDCLRRQNVSIADAHANFEDVQALIVDKQQISDAIEKYLWAEKELVSTYSDLLKITSKRSDFAEQWKTKSSKIDRDLKSFLQPQENIFEELEFFSEFANLENANRRALSETGRISLYSRNSVGNKTK